MPRPEISAILKLQSTQFVGELRKTRGQLTQFGNSVRAIGSLVAGVFVTGAIARSVKRTADFADELGKMSAQLGFSTDALQEYRFVAEKAGLSQAELDKSLTAFTRRLGAFKRDGGGPAARALEELGIALEDIQGLNTEQALRLVSDRMATLGDRTAQVNISQELFSESGRRMNLVVGKGSKAFDEQAEALDKLNGKLSGETIQNAEAFNDAMVDFDRTISALSTNLGATFLPALTKMADIISKFVAKDAPGFQQAMRALLSGDLTDAERINTLLERREQLLLLITKIQADREASGGINSFGLGGNSALDMFSLSLESGAGGLERLQLQLKNVNSELKELQEIETSRRNDAETTTLDPITVEATSLATKLEKLKELARVVEATIKIEREQAGFDKLASDAKIEFLRRELNANQGLLAIRREIALLEAKEKGKFGVDTPASFQGGGFEISGTLNDANRINADFDSQGASAVRATGEEIAELNKAPETFADGWQNAFSRFTQDSTIAFGVGQIVAQNFASGVQGLFRTQFQGLFNDLESGTLSWKDSLESTIDIIKGIVVQILAAVAAQATLVALGGGAPAAPGIAQTSLGSLGGGGAGGSGGRFAGLFAKGGSFRVNGRGGVDRNLVSLGVSQGERVTVETPSQQARGGISVVVNNTSSSVRAGAETRNQPGGGKTIDILIEDIVDNSIRRGRIGQTMAGTFGLGRTGRVG